MMRDEYGREISYMRISLTDRCDLRCRYCRPDAAACAEPDDVLHCSEILRICRQALSVGIVNFKVTGGEPLLRLGAVNLIRDIKALPGVRSVTLTTNGLRLEQNLEALERAGIDSINVSLDARSEKLYRALCGGGSAERVVRAIRESAKRGIPTKVNTVLLPDNTNEWRDIARLAEELPVDVRFIELMPIGEARNRLSAVPAYLLRARLLELYPDLAPAPQVHGNGPAAYYASDRLKGNIGVIASGSDRFCGQCNRIRLTSTGRIRTCLARPDETDLRLIMRSGGSDEAVREALRAAIRGKPQGHRFAEPDDEANALKMYEIGG